MLLTVVRTRRTQWFLFNLTHATFLVLSFLKHWPFLWFWRAHSHNFIFKFSFLCSLHKYLRFRSFLFHESSSILYFIQASFEIFLKSWFRAQRNWPRDSWSLLLVPVVWFAARLSRFVACQISFWIPGSAIWGSEGFFPSVRAAV